MEVLPFKPDHIELLEMRPSEAVLLKDHPNFPIYLAAEYCGGTLFHDGRVIGIIGFKRMWPGVIEVWAFPSIYVEQYSLIYLKTCKQYINQIAETEKPHRIQTTGIADEQTDRWMKFLGLECTGELPMYSSTKQDHRIWSKTYGAE
jgi:hypothetical protein